MPVSAGTRLGPYEIVAPIGAGGMGEVWRARDTRLERNVAIKILPAEFSEQLKSRFEREAKAISQLNHPNICSLYDVGHINGTDYIVMELIEGETLADRLARGPLPLPDVMKYGAQIADALERAHRSGIIHRDLKPSNIMITKSGAKLLDFGLAKNTTIDLGAEGPTQHKSLTREGTIVGTFQYMSPEQLEGAIVDPRSDIFGLGAVLYEMATGKRAFEGKTKTSLIAAIVSGSPVPLSQVQPFSPPALEDVIASCLAKDPDARIQSAHDVALDLRRIGDSRAAQTAGRSKLRENAGWIMAALLAAALIGFAWVAHTSHTPAAQVVRFTIEPPPNTSILGVMSVSPNGRQVVFRALGLAGPSMLWLRSLDRLDARPLNGTEGSTFAFWSPDGRHIGFMARGKLSRLDTADGTVRTIYEPIDSVAGGATWNDRDVILFSPKPEAAMLRIAASGGEATPIAKPAGAIEIWPSFLPDGDHYIFSSSEKGKTNICVGSLSSNQRTLLTSVPRIGSSRAIYADGYLFYYRGPALIAQQFDLRKLALVGNPIKVEDSIEFYSPGRAAFSVSPGGTLAYRKRGAPIVSQLALVDSTGRRTVLPGEPLPYEGLRLSPDQKRIAFERNDDEGSVWTLDVTRGTVTRVAFDEWSGLLTWMPDSRALVYAAVVDTPPNIYLKRADGSVERLTHSDQQQYPTSVTPDGRFVVYAAVTQQGYDLYAVSVAPPHTSFPIATSPFAEQDGIVSPDGRWIAYTSNESGSQQIHATTFPRPGQNIQISTAGGIRARWSHDGRRLYYFEPAQKRIMSVAIDSAGGELKPALPVPVLSMPTPDYDVAADGRFLVSEDQINRNSPGVTVILNWTEALK